MKITIPRISTYAGNGPYCYANSLVMSLDDETLTAGAVETLTGSPFGFQLLAGRVPLFDPFGWDPDIGLDQALGLLGYSHSRRTFDAREEAVAALKNAVRDGPVLVGPLDMGLLAQQPGSEGATGTDHFVVALEVSETSVAFHDPQGYPWTSLPLETFCDAWRGEEIGYLEGSYALRTDFLREAPSSVDDALQASLPLAADWLAGRDLPVPAGTVGGRQGLEQLADIVAEDFDDNLRERLIGFGLRIGARRRADAAACLARLGQAASAAILQDQARTLGSLQYLAIRRDVARLSSGFRLLGQLHEMACRELGIVAAT